MTQSASGPYPVRPIDENEIDGFISVDEHAFNTSPWSADDRRVALDLFEFDRTLAAFDDTTPVGVTMCYTFQLSVPGLQMLPAAGVTFVAVMPTYRRQGVLSSLMRRQLADVRDRGEPLQEVFWRHAPAVHPVPRSPADWVPSTPESAALAKRLRKEGFRFLGATTIHAAMQACGVVNDHLEGCWVRDQVELERAV